MVFVKGRTRTKWNFSPGSFVLTNGCIDAQTTCMEHFEVVYFFGALCIGLVSWGAMTLAYAQTRDELLLYYLGFQSAFTILIGVVLSLDYLIAAGLESIDPFSASIPAILWYAYEFIWGNVTLFALLIWTYILFQVERQYFKTLLWGSGMLVLGISYHVVIFAMQYPFLRLAGYTLNSLCTGVVILYSFGLGIRYYRKMRNDARKRIARTFLLLLGMMFPAACIEILLEIFASSVSFYPLMYCAMSLVMPYYLVKYAFFQTAVPRSASQISPESTSHSELLQPAVNPPPRSGEILAPTRLVQYDISARERDVIELLVQGKSNAEIGEILCISISTVKTHLSNIYTKCGAKSRYELLILFREDGSAPNHPKV